MEQKRNKKQRMNKTRQAFLLSFFSPTNPKYETKQINGFVLVRQFNGNTNDWQVAIYTKESWGRVQEWKKFIENEA